MLQMSSAKSCNTMQLERVYLPNVYKTLQNTRTRKSQTLPTPKERPPHRQLLVCSSSYTSPQLTDHNQQPKTNNGLQRACQMDDSSSKICHAGNGKQSRRFQLQNAATSRVKTWTARNPPNKNLKEKITNVRRKNKTISYPFKGFRKHPISRRKATCIHWLLW